MDRAERQGLGLALAGHVALVLALVFGLFSPKRVPPPIADVMSVRLVTEVAPRSAAPEAAKAPPAPRKAEVAGKPAEAAPPKPAPTPAPPKPAPAPPKAAPAPPKPTPPRPTPPKPTPPKPAPPKPTPPKPAPPKPSPPKPTPKPAPPKPKPKPEKPTPEKPAPKKPAPEKSAPEKPAKATKPTPPKPDKSTPDKSAKAAPAKTAASAKSAKASKTAKDDKDFTLPSDLRAHRPDEHEGNGTSGKAAKHTGSLLGSDISKDIAAARESKDSKSSAPQAAQVGARAMAGLAAAIAAQVKPCYNVPAGGTGSNRIVTVLRLRFNQDGSVAGTPGVADHEGVDDANRAYVRQMDDAAKRAVLRCAPLKLPPELYENGWSDITIGFHPEALGG